MSDALVSFKLNSTQPKKGIEVMKSIKVIVVMVLVACTIGASMFYHEYSKLENSCKLLKRLDDSNKRFRASMKELATAQLGALRAGHINMENGACELLQMIVMADVQPEDIGTTYHEIIRLSQKTATLWLHE